MSIKAFLDAINVLKTVDPKDFSDLATDQSLEKAASLVGGSEHIPEVWDATRLHSAPPKHEIKVGSPEHASGGGAEKMVRDYSNPAPQTPNVNAGLDLEGYLGSLSAHMKSLSAAVSLLIQNQQTMKSALLALTAKGAVSAKASEEEDEEDEEESEEESEVVEINEKAAKKNLVKASKLIRTLKVKKAEMEEAKEDGDSKACKTLRAEIKALKAKISDLLAKARNCAYAAHSDELKKSIRKAATKADINVVQEEEEDEEDEEEEEEDTSKAKVAADTSKAKADATGNQADSADPATHNQADHAKAAAPVTATPTMDPAVQAKLDAALSGVDTLKATVNNLMDVISGQSKVTDLALPNIAKAVAAKSFTPAALYTAVDDAEDAGTLSSSEALAAHDIVHRLENVVALGGDTRTVTDRLAKTTSNVKSFFNTQLGTAAAA